MIDEPDSAEARAIPPGALATPKHMLLAAGIIAGGLVAGGFLLGDGLVRMKAAERSVTVRGLAEREVTADLATWTLSLAATATNLQTAQASTDRDAEALRAFFADLGFPESALTPAGVNVSNYTDDGTVFDTVRQRIVLRTKDIDRAQRAVRSQADLVRKGVVLEDGSGISYTFTELNAIKPAMVAEATRDARAAAEQFAKDSGADVGGIRKRRRAISRSRCARRRSRRLGIGDTRSRRYASTTVDFALD